MNNDDLKFLAGALALVISSVTVQINIATFVNRVRDECHQKRQVLPAPRFRLFSEIFDFL